VAKVCEQSRTVARRVSFAFRTFRLALLWVVVVALALAAGCGEEAVSVENEAATIVTLDGLHDHAHGNDSAAFYDIGPCDSISVEVGGYSIPVPAGAESVRVNAIHSISGSDQFYRVAWDGVSPITLDASTLSAVKGPRDFEGFIATT